VKGRLLPLVMSAGTLAVGVLLALRWAAGTEWAPLGWMFALLGLLGVATATLLPAGPRRS